MVGDVAVRDFWKGLAEAEVNWSRHLLEFGVLTMFEGGGGCLGKCSGGDALLATDGDEAEDGRGDHWH